VLPDRLRSLLTFSLTATFLGLADLNAYFLFACVVLPDRLRSLLTSSLTATFLGLACSNAYFLFAICVA
jgi:hypothetical protein